MKIAIGFLTLILVIFSLLVLNRARASYRVRFEDFQGAAGIEPWDWSHQFQVGNVLLSQSKAKEAIPYFLRANALMPYHWGPVNNLAVAYGMAGDVNRADKTVNQLLVLFPGNPIIMENRVIIDNLIKEKSP